MTAKLGQHGPIWFFTSTESSLVQNLGDGARAVAIFASKRHDIFASVHGSVVIDNDRATIEHMAILSRPGTSTRLELLRLNAEWAEIWLDGSSIIAGVKMLLGVDPKRDYKKNVADVPLN